MEKRKIVAGYLLWAFLNLFLLFFSYYVKIDDRGKHGSMFGKMRTSEVRWHASGSFIAGDLTSDPLLVIFPFEGPYYAYDVTEFIIYVITPALLYFLYRYVKGENEPLLP
jgi:hypothetical protein